MYKIIKKVKGWARPDSYVPKQHFAELVQELEAEDKRRIEADFKGALDRVDLIKENKELKVQIKELQDRNTGLRLQKQILDNISHVGYHPDYVQGLKDQIEELNVKLAVAERTLEPSALDIGTAIHSTIEQIFAENLEHINRKHIQDQEAEIKELKNQLTQALMYKAPGAEKEIESLQQINASILDVVAAQKDYTHKLEAALGAYGATKAEVEKVQYSVREVPAAYEPRWLDVK